MTTGDYIDEVIDPDDANDDEKEELSQLIDRLLAEMRPERYDIADKDWMAAVIEKASDELEAMDRDDLIADVARRRVHGREAQATRKANDFLRLIARTGQLPLGWGEGDEWKLMQGGVLRLPISIEKLRVRLGAASPNDLEEWILAREEQQDRELAARELSRNGAVLLREWMSSQHVLRVEDLRAQPSTA
jgi:hypothetical protein